MKDKVKDGIFIISMFYSVVIVVLMFYAYFNTNNVLEIVTSDNDKAYFDEQIKKYKDDLNSIESRECQNEISKLITYFEKTTYNGKVNLRDKYFEDESFMTYVQDTFVKCNIPTEEQKTMGLKAVNSSALFEGEIQKYRFQYEIRIPDIAMRKTIEPSMSNTAYSLSKYSELEFIKDAIELSKEGIE